MLDNDVTGYGFDVKDATKCDVLIIYKCIDKTVKILSP